MAKTLLLAGLLLTTAFLALAAGAEARMLTVSACTPVACRAATIQVPPDPCHGGPGSNLLPPGPCRLAPPDPCFAQRLPGMRDGFVGVCLSDGPRGQ